MTFFGELKRRNVFRAGIAYLLAAWVLLQIVDFVLDAISAPNWIVQVFILAAAVGLPVVLVFSWVFEMTPEGVKRESEIDRSRSITPATGRKLDRVIIVFLAVAVVLLLADRFLGSRDSQAVSDPAQAESSQTIAEQESADPVGGRRAADEVAPNEKSIAVLPFLALSSGPDDEYFADGLTEEILNSLAQLPELLVTARTSAFHFKDKDIPIQEIAAQLGVTAVVEGSVRRSGDRLRVTVQLIRAADGFHLWSENYDSTSKDTIAVQEDIAEKIATAMNVVMNENKREAMHQAGLRDVEAFIAWQKGLELAEKGHGDADMFSLLRQANDYFEIVQQRAPKFPLAWGFHADLYTHQLLDGANNQPGGLTDPAEIERAQAQAIADYEAALRLARTPQERNNADIDLAYVTGDWRGMPARLERHAGEQGCSGTNWLENISLPYGYAEVLLTRQKEFTVCNPFSSAAWRAAVRTLLWSGDFDQALQYARKGSELAPGEWLSMMLVFAHVALGQFEEAEAEINSRLQTQGDALAARMLVAAARGDREQASRILALRGQEQPESDFWGLMMHSWAGDRERANQIAARMDEHPFGSQALATTTLWCLCGEGWDLAVTPNFAARIEASGLPWPPASPIKFPLKNW